MNDHPISDHPITDTIRPTSAATPTKKPRATFVKVAVGVGVLLMLSAVLPFLTGDSSTSSPSAPSHTPLDTSAKADTDETSSETFTGREALTHWIALMESGVERLSTTPIYTATFDKRERVSGTLLDGEVMAITLRHQPFSVHAKWLVGNSGQELLYVDGANDPRILVRVGGWKGRMMPALKLDPHGSLAMKSSRHPITDIGLKNLLHKLLDHRRQDAALQTLPRCRLDMVTTDRPAHRFVIEYQTPGQRPGISEVYRRSIVYLDREWLVPTAVENHGWADSPTDTSTFDDTTLLESYRYTDINFDPGTSDLDFKRDNPEYAFRR
jgi:hypothetical protein